MIKGAPSEKVYFEPVIESEISGVDFILIDKHIVISAGPSGQLAVRMSMVDQFIAELKSIKEVWENVRI